MLGFIHNTDLRFSIAINHGLWFRRIFIQKFEIRMNMHFLNANPKIKILKIQFKILITCKTEVDYLKKF